MDAEIDVTVELVHTLLRAQHHDLADLPIVPLAHGWDNELFRLGDDLVLRFPRRALAAPLLEAEQRWLPLIAESLPVAVPAPVRIGRPGAGYPWSWSVLPWLDGASALTADFDERALADDLITFLRAMHRDAPDDVPLNPFRGVPLRDRDVLTRERISSVAARFDEAALHRSWEESLEASPYAGVPRLLHGDVHPGNLLVRDRRLGAVIDLGDLCGGDPTTDLGAAWMLFADDDLRAYFLDALTATRDDRLRARGWALSVSLAIAVTPGPTPLSDVAELAIARVLADHCP